MATSVEDAQFTMELAKIGLAMAKARRDLGDDRLSVQDVAAIGHAAQVFGVTQKAAYLRARGMGLLSYQEYPAHDR